MVALARGLFARSEVILLLPVLLQKLLYRVLFTGAQRTKPSLVIDEDDLRRPKVDQHVRQVVAVDIDEAERHGRQVLSAAVHVAGLAEVPAMVDLLGDHREGVIEGPADMADGFMTQTAAGAHRCDRAKKPAGR